MSSSSRHTRKTGFRTSDYYSTSASASPSSSRLQHPSADMRTHSPTSSYWDTVIINDSKSKSMPRSCPTCARTFSSSHAFEQHVATCSNEKPYVCPECGTAFKKNSNLIKHTRLVHRGEKNFQCELCGRPFGQKSNLNSHIKAVHLGEKPFVCETEGCGKRFSQKSGLKAHIKTVHNRERPYVCTVENCKSSFGHRGDVSSTKPSLIL